MCMYVLVNGTYRSVLRPRFLRCVCACVCVFVHYRSLVQACELLAYEDVCGGGGRGCRVYTMMCVGI